MSEVIIFICGMLFGAVMLYFYALSRAKEAVQQYIQATEEEVVVESPQFYLEKHDGQYMAYAAEDSRFAGQGATLNDVITLLSKERDVVVMSEDATIVAELKSFLKG